MFTRAQRAEILQFLGYSSRFGQVWGQIDSAIEAMDADPDMECRVLELLANAKAADAAIQNLATDCAKVVEVDGVKFRGHYALSLQREIGFQNTAGMSDALGVPQHDGGYFRPSGRSNWGIMGSGGFPPYG